MQDVLVVRARRANRQWRLVKNILGGAGEDGDRALLGGSSVYAPPEEHFEK